MIVTAAVPSTAPSSPVPQNLDAPLDEAFCNTILVPSYANMFMLLALIVPFVGSLPPEVLILLAHNQSKLIVQAHVLAVVNLPTNICPVV